MPLTHEKNQAAFQEAKRALRNQYPSGRFVAFDDGQIVADAASFDELTKALAAIGKDRPDVFVVQTGGKLRAAWFDPREGTHRLLSRRPRRVKARTGSWC
jgi:hypothetical protein